MKQLNRLVFPARGSKVQELRGFEEESLIQFKILENDPLNTAAYHELGLLTEKVGKNLEAQRFLRKQ